MSPRPSAPFTSSVAPPQGARSRRAPGDRRGFTLLEVMVALGILAGALLAVSEIVSSAMRNHVRARNLEVATLLARGKMAELEDHYEAKGFRPTEESDEGTFEEEGHPEVHWQLQVAVPSVELGPEGVARALTGSADGLASLFPSAEEGSPLGPVQAMLTAAIQPVLTKLGEQLKTGVREVSLTVSWPEGGVEEKFAVRTHMVVLAPGEGVQDVMQQGAQPGAQSGVQPGSQKGGQQ